MSGHEVIIGFQWLQTLLSSDTTLASLAPGGIHRSVAPSGTATPYVVVAHQSGVDSTTMNGVRVLTDMTYQIKAVGPVDQEIAIEAAAARIDDLLDNPPKAGTVSNGIIYDCNRQTPFLVDEVIGGVVWSSIGGLYRIEAGKS